MRRGRILWVVGTVVALMAATAWLIDRTRDSPLVGHSFQTYSIEIDGEATDVASASVLTVGFSSDEDGDAVGWDLGCNTHSGPVEIADNSLRVDSAGGTLMGCDRPTSKQERLLSRFFSGDLDWSLDSEDRLTLSGEGVVIRLVSEPPGHSARFRVVLRHGPSDEAALRDAFSSLPFVNSVRLVSKNDELRALGKGLGLDLRGSIGKLNRRLLLAASFEIETSRAIDSADFEQALLEAAGTQRRLVEEVASAEGQS